MNEGLIFNGKKYLPSKQAADLTGYKIDYVGQLCRTGKVESKRIGRTWFVSEDSILKHKETALPNSGESRLSEKSKSEAVKSIEKALPVESGFANLPVQDLAHKSDANPLTSLPRHFHFFDHASADSMTRLLSLFIVAVLFSSILIAKENNPFPAAASLIKTTGTSLVANVSFAPAHFMAVVVTTFETATNYNLQTLSDTGDKVLSLVDWLGGSYLGIVKETAKVGDLFTDSPIANLPGQIFTTGTKLFSQIYQNLGANLRQDVLALAQSDFSDQVVNGPVRLAERYVLGVQNLAALYQQLGAQLRIDLASYPESAIVAVYPKVFSQSFNNFSQTFSNLYQQLGVLTRVEAVGYLQSDLVVGYPSSFVRGVSAFSQNFANLYQNLGLDFRTRVAKAGSSKFVAVMFGWPEVASNGLASVIETVPNFYQTLGFNFRNQIGKGSTSVAAVTIATPSDGQTQTSSWFGNFKNSADDFSLRVIYILRLARDETLDGLSGGYLNVKSAVVSGFNKVGEQLGFVWGQIKSAPVALYRSVTAILSGDYYSRLTQYLNVSEQTPEMNVGGVLATKAENENRGIAVKPSAGVVADEAAKQEIRDTFSDNVEVIPDETGQSGIVKPNFKSGRSSSYVYVLVPVKQ